MNNDVNQSGKNSIAEILRVILILQQNACCETTLDSCDRPMLGGGPNCLICNTRPVMLYLCSGNGCPLSMPISKDSTTVCSNPQVNNCSIECSHVFRVEKLDGNAATFRVLMPNPEENCCNSQPYLSTNSYFTIDLSCCCIIRCLNDTYVDCA